MITENKIKSLASGVPRMHILTSALNLLFLILAVVGYVGKAPSLVAVGIVGGYFANALAIVTGVAVSAWLLVARFTGTAAEVWQLHWLAIVNGVVVAGAWALIFIFG